MVDEMVPRRSGGSTRMGGFCGGRAYSAASATAFAYDEIARDEGLRRGSGTRKKKCPGGRRKPLKRLDSDKENKVNCKEIQSFCKRL